MIHTALFHLCACIDGSGHQLPVRLMWWTSPVAVCKRNRENSIEKYCTEFSASCQPCSNCMKFPYSLVILQGTYIEEWRLVLRWKRSHLNDGINLTENSWGCPKPHNGTMSDICFHYVPITKKLLVIVQQKAKWNIFAYTVFSIGFYAFYPSVMSKWQHWTLMGEWIS